MLLALTVVMLPTTSANAGGEATCRNPLPADGAFPWPQCHNGNYYLATTLWNEQLVMRYAPTSAGLSTAAVTIFADRHFEPGGIEAPLGRLRAAGRP